MNPTENEPQEMWERAKPHYAAVREIVMRTLQEEITLRSENRA